MSGFYLTDGTSTFSFSPEFGYKNDGLKDHNEKRAKTGKRYTYTFNAIEAWKIPIMYVSDSDASLVNGWWEDDTILSIAGDILTGVFTVQISGKKKPFPGLIKPYDDQYKGTISLEEV